MKKKHMIIESSIFFIISSIVYLYVKKNNPNNVIERYYMTQSKVLYKCLQNCSPPPLTTDEFISLSHESLYSSRTFIVNIILLLVYHSSI